MKLTEAQIQGQIIDWLRLHGAVVTRINSGSVLLQNSNGSTRRVKLADAGTSDIIACLHGGEYVAIEVKRPGEKPTPAQELFIDQVNATGGLAFVAHSLEDVMRELGQEEKC
jgi:hypothetical protein